MEVRGRLFKIKRFCLHDGPGIRTTVFLKGCPLSCVWCHSPEGISSDIPVWYNHNDCISCGTCVKSCSYGALELQDNKICIDRKKCRTAGDCVRVCPSRAITYTGFDLDADMVMQEIEKDIIFYESSGGGVTLSGGEPLFQPDFSHEILRRCSEKNIHTAVETSLFCSEQTLEKIAKHVDLFIVDLKIFDPDQHRKYTGQSNEIIKSNFLYLSRKRRNIAVRIPLISRITDTDENRDAIADFLKTAGESIPVEFISYNPLAPNNYERLGVPFFLNRNNLT